MNQTCFINSLDLDGFKLERKKMIESVIYFSECSKPGFNLIGVKLCKCINGIITESHVLLYCISNELCCVSPGVKRLSLEKSICLYWLSCFCTHDWLSLVMVYIPTGKEW